MTPNYAIDVHGTLAVRVPDGVAPSHLFPLLTGLMKVWVKNGSAVVILSGPTATTIQKEVDSLGLVKGVHYTSILSMVDFLRAVGADMWEDPVGSGQPVHGLEMLHTKVVLVDGLWVSVPGGPPSCSDCSKLILDSGIAHMWLMEEREGEARPVRYTASEFHEQTLRNCGLHPYRKG